VRQLRVSTPQGESGTLTKESRHVFAYATHERARQVSLTMPLRAETYAETPMLPAFSMNRPEGFLLERIQRAFKHVQLDDMALLAITGGNQIGRLRYEEPGKATRGKRAEVGLATLLKTGSQAGLFEHLVETYLESGISGFQPKVMIPDADKLGKGNVGEKTTATTPSLILKAAGDDYPHLPASSLRRCARNGTPDGLPWHHCACSGIRQPRAARLVPAKIVAFPQAARLPIRP
jgi:serine/threonine-protein kinase HipA